jgi:Ca2+-binding RTX toxin-like protein
VNLAQTTAANASAVGGITSNLQLVIGGAGNDVLQGQASKSTILVGLSGDDRLTGGSQRDLLFGGAGADMLAGSGGDDLLISGSTSHDTNRQALFAIYAEWISSRTFAVRTANLWGNGSGANANGNIRLNSDPNDSLADTVFADSNIDALTGGLNQDWFFASLNDTYDFVGTGATPDRLNQ